MKCKKVLCGILAAALITGTFQGSIVTMAAPDVTGNESVVIEALAESNFTFDKDTAAITKYVGTASEVVIPSTINGVAVKVIGEDAFASNEVITSVVIPKGVTTIESEAFLNCPNLKSIKIPNGVTTIGSVAFFKCISLEKVTFGKGVEKIAESAFYGCEQLKEINIPNTVKTIEAGAFMGCTSLNNVAVPNSVNNIGWGAFQNCEGLTVISVPSTVTVIGEDALTGCSQVKVTCEAGSKIYEYAQTTGLQVNVVDKVDNVTPEIEDDVTPTPAPTNAPTNTPTSKPVATPTQAPKETVYSIRYVVNGGTIKGSKVVEYNGKSNVKLPKVVRKGYTFGGWYTEKSYETKVTVLKQGTTGNKVLYAKWTKVKKPAKVTISSVKSKKSKQMTVKLKKKVSGAKGYELICATDKKFKKNKKVVQFSGTSKTIKSLKKGKTYYVKVRAYKIDSANEEVYGTYSSVKKVTIKK